LGDLGHGWWSDKKSPAEGSLSVDGGQPEGGAAD
jgi:hypothetical protein